MVKIICIWSRFNNQSNWIIQSVGEFKKNPNLDWTPLHDFIENNKNVEYIIRITNPEDSGKKELNDFKYEFCYNVKFRKFKNAYGKMCDDDIVFCAEIDEEILANILLIHR